MANEGEVLGPELIDDRVYVAVGKDPSQSKSTLLWALNKFRGKGICILHVHEPAKWIPLMGSKFLAKKLEAHLVREYRDIERQTMNEILHIYSSICDKAGVQASTLYIEMDSIEKGIIGLITRNGIKKLVMGAAADKHYSKKMIARKSKKSIYVCKQAPSTSHIWFICKGNLVYTREGELNESSMDVAFSILLASPNSETAEFSFSSSQSVIEGQNRQLCIAYSGPEYSGVRSQVPQLESQNLSPSSTNRATHFIDWNEISGRSSSVTSRCSASSSSDMANLSSLPYQTENQLRHSSPPSVLEGGMKNELYDQLEQAMAEAEVSERQAFEESMRRRKAEKDILDAIRKGKVSENKAEEASLRGNVEFETMKQQLDETMEELCKAHENKQSLETRIASSEEMVRELEQKMFSSVELLQKYKKERDELEVECVEALKVAEELKKKLADDKKSTFMLPHYFSHFSLSEIETATSHFDTSLKIDKEGNGSTYRGILHHTQVAIKMVRGPLDFQHEVSILSKLRHPNIITLIGACHVTRALVYEYLPNGSLEDRLNCQDNTPPLSWQTRIRIAAELCSVLIFLHSCNNPRGITHGDLNPANILLDANYVSKLCNFRLYRVLTQNKVLKGSTTIYPSPKQELTPESDVHSFGIILLQLLTGKPGSGIIIMQVRSAYDDGKLKDLLDPTAGDWPFVQAKQLAHLALRCCDMIKMNRPDLASEASRVLENMRLSCGVSSEEHRQIPHYFVCPIFQEIMEDPHVAADGFTYELEALKGWLDSGHNTSPMTNLQLPHHNLVPNRALRSAIQEWQQNK